MRPAQNSALRPIRTQTVTVAAASAAVTNAFGNGISTLWISSTTACHYVIGAAPVATTSDAYLPANWVQEVAIRPGEKIAFIQNASGGTAYATEVSA